MRVTPQNTRTLGFKWKTGNHDEQPQIPDLDDLRFANQRSRDLYQHLLDIYRHRIVEAEVEKKAATPAVTQSELANDVNVAFERELSKRSAGSALLVTTLHRMSFTDVPKKDRGAIAAELTKSVLAEVMGLAQHATELF